MITNTGASTLDRFAPSPVETIMPSDIPCLSNAGVNLPYRRMDIGMSPVRTLPWWYVSRSLAGQRATPGSAPLSELGGWRGGREDAARRGAPHRTHATVCRPPCVLRCPVASVPCPSPHRQIALLRTPSPCVNRFGFDENPSPKSTKSTILFTHDTRTNV
jgi:hypothetical protein